MAAATGCGEQPRTRGDAGAPGGVRTLEVVGGPEIGVAPAEHAGIAVRYREEDGTPVAGAEISFAIYGDPRGSTLSADRAVTGDDGIAEVDLSAAPVESEYEFRVRASADTASVEFFVAVSATGFADLVVRFAYTGEQEGEVSPPFVRLYAGDCAAIDPGEPPPAEDSVRLPVVATSLDGEARFERLLTQQPYAAFADAVGGKAHAVAGCTDIGAGRLRAGAEAATVVVLDDLPLSLAGAFAVSSSFALGDVEEVGVAVGRVDDLGDCVLDPAERLLDAIRDATDADTASAIDAARGEPGGGGCRVGGLDADLMALLYAADTALVEAVRAAGSAATALADMLTIESTLDVGSDLSAAHELDLISFAAGDAYAPALPIVEAPLRASLDGDAVALGQHAFTLRLGTLLARAVTDVAAGGVDPRTVATRLVEAGDCDAIEALLCDGAALGPGCLGEACAGGAAALDAETAAGFAALDGAGLDFWLDGAAVATDGDGDGAIDSLAEGAWAAAVGDGALALGGIFEATGAVE